MSFLRRIWQLVRYPTRYVGRDLEGNKFYEYPTPDPDRRSRRVVRYRDQTEVWRYIGGGKTLPVQWSAWLTHTRQHPPTIQELQVDLERQHRVRMNAELIEARDREWRAKVIAQGASDTAEARQQSIRQPEVPESPPPPPPPPPVQEVEVPFQVPMEPKPVRRAEVDQKDTIQKSEPEPPRKEPEWPREDSGRRRLDAASSPAGVAQEPVESPWVEHTPESLRPKTWDPQTRKRGD